MSLFKSEFSKKHKEQSHHPWENRIKDIYSRTYKYGHNSANNPVYPPEKVDILDKGIKFTVIGNRITKEFIYCLHLVKGLHKYRQKEFKAPVIRGVTSVEWPKIWNDLKILYGGLTYCLRSQVAILMNDQFLGGEDELKAFIESKYVYYFRLDYYKEGIKQFAHFVKSSGRPFAYLQISIDGAPIGTLIFMLYADIVPNTCENFLRLCESKKGGYGGTPIHRIVEDCWIQCGGFGLKSSNLSCENFIVPPDRRGVLCMANDGRHVDCSTQFFVLLQPATWMKHKYVAFGQLIEGGKTLEKIEKVPTWYESPLSKIVIYNAGVFNMECHNIPINKNTHAYLHSHIEDLFTVGEMFYEELLETVFLIVELRYLQSLENTEQEVVEEDGVGKNVHSTKRFMRKREDIKKQTPETVASSASEDNDEFDVDVYEYEFEGFEDYTYSKQVSVHSVIVKPEKPFYLAFTDVPYPGEVDSTYDLKKFLNGDYCLEMDLEKNPAKRRQQQLDAKKGLSIPSDLCDAIIEEYELNEDNSGSSLDTNDEIEIEKYIEENTDSVSFAGPVIRKIADINKKYEFLKETEGRNEKLNNILTDEELRILRVATKEYKSAREKKTSVSIVASKGSHSKIKRRQTGFALPDHLAKIHVFPRNENIDEEEEDLFRKSGIAPAELSNEHNGDVRRVLGPGSEAQLSSAPPRQSILSRLYEDVTRDSDDEEPTLKHYKPVSEAHHKKFMLITHSPTRILNDDDSREKFRRRSHVEENSIDQVLSLQHGKKVSRKISSDYVRTIDHIEHNLEKSVISSMEFAKKRPSISVEQYQLKNQKYKEE